jgi:hypothetical protein
MQLQRFLSAIGHRTQFSLCVFCTSFIVSYRLQGLPKTMARVMWALFLCKRDFFPFAKEKNRAACLESEWDFPLKGRKFPLTWHGPLWALEKGRKGTYILHAVVAWSCIWPWYGWLASAIQRNSFCFCFCFFCFVFFNCLQLHTYTYREDHKVVPLFPNKKLF